MKRSDQIEKLAAALAKAQRAFTAAERSHTAKVETKAGGFYSFAYADLASYLEVVREPLGDNGLAVIQEAFNDGAEVYVITLLVHESGQWLETEPFRLKLIGQGEKNTITPQTVGSAVTYARRYSLSSLIGLASEADDDGNAASGNAATTERRERAGGPLPACPECGKQTSVITGKSEFGGGLVCFRKKDGCGHTWACVGHEYVNRDTGEKIPFVQSTSDYSPSDAPANGVQADPVIDAAIATWQRFFIENGDDIEIINKSLADLKNAAATPPAAAKAVWNHVVKPHAEAMGWEFSDTLKRFVGAATV